MKNILRELSYLEIFLILVILYLLFKKKYEKLEDIGVTEELIRDKIREVYDTDIESIKRLNELTQKIYDSEGKLSLPGDLEVSGYLHLHNDIKVYEKE